MLVPTYDLLNCGLRNRFSANGKIIHNSEKVNMQNLQRTDKKDKTKGLLRQAIIAPPGHTLVVADLSQIEARMLVYQANQHDKVEAFAQKRDVYSEQASVIYGRHVDRKNNPDDFQRGFIGKSVTLGAGFGLGFGKFGSSMHAGFLGGSAVTFGDTYVDELGVDVEGFISWLNNPRRQDMALRLKEAKPLALDEQEWMTHLSVAQSIIKTYRADNDKVVDYWGLANDVLTAMLHGEVMEFGGPDNNMLTTSKNSIWLPNGMRLQYDDLKCEKGEWSFLRKKEGRVQRVKTYGGSLVENCIAEGTRVLTDRGWRAIEQVQCSDKIHDGVEFVQHSGLVLKSVQTCITVDGVYMTPDHEVLTDDGWQEASQLQGHHRAALWRPNRDAPTPYGREEMALDVPMQLRRTSGEARAGRDKKREERGSRKLWVQGERSYPSSKLNAWYDQAPRVLGMAKYAGSVSLAITSGVEKLRGAWHSCVQTMGEVIRGVLGGHGGCVPAWVGLGSHQQRWAILPGELSVGDTAYQFHESEEHRTKGRCVRACEGNRDQHQHDILPTGKWVAYRGTDESPIAKKQVYDILNCGPRNRFVVLGDNGPFIVHNCTQALARIVITNTMRKADKMGIKVALQVHDEVVLVVPEEDAQVVYDWTIKQMRKPPKWAPGLPLDAEGGFGKSYGGIK